MPQDKVKEVYDLISELGYFEDENEFRNYVSDPKKRKEAFSLISDAGYFEDENEFNSYFESEKKKPSGEIFSQDFPTFRQGVGQSVKPSSQSPLKSQSTTTTTPLPKTTKQAPKDSLGTYNPTGRVRLYNEAKNNIQNRIPQLVEQFNQAQAAGDEQAMQEIEAMINADTQKLDFFDKAVQGQKQLAATQQPDNIGNTMATALEMAGGYLASGVNFIDEAINQSISDAIGFKLSDKALKEINELNSKAPVKRPSDIIAKAGREMLETANKASEERRMNMPYSGGVYEALKSGDFKNAVSNAGYAFTTSLPTSLLMANPITGGLSAAGMAQESVEEARAEKGSVNTDDYIVGALKASTEYVFENMLGTGRQLKELVAKLGKEGAVEATEQVLRAGLKDYFKKLGVNIAEESVGEGLTQITQNAIDKSTGKEVGLFDNVADAALIGLFGGATQGTLTTTISHYIDRAKLKEAEAAKAKAAELAEQALNAPSQVVADAIEREAEKLNDWADEIIEWNNEIGANADPEIIAEIESNNDKIDELEATIAESTPEIAEILTIQLQEIETENAELIKTAEQIALERLESILNEKDSKKNNEEPLSKGVSGLRTESESGQESPELRPEQEEVVQDEPTIIESDTPKGDTSVEVTEPAIQDGEGQVEVEKEAAKEGKATNIINGFKFTATPSLTEKGGLKVTPIDKSNNSVIEAQMFIDGSTNALRGGVKNEGNGWFSAPTGISGARILYNPTTKVGVEIDAKSVGIAVNDFVKNNSEQKSPAKEQTKEAPKPLEIKEEVPAKEQGVEIKEQAEWDSDEGKKKIEGEITISGKDYYTISIDGEKSNQLILKSELDKEIQLDKSKFDSKTKFDKIRLENESKEKLDAEELKNLNGFGSDLTPMQLGKVVKDLNKKESYNGVIKTRKKAIEDFVKEGRTVETLKNGKRVLQKKDGTFLDSLTKIELDYAEFLIAQTENKVEPTAEKTLDAKNDPNKVVEKTLEEEMADFDFNSLGSESSESVSVQETIDNEREEAYKKSRFDKKWAATYKEAKEKVIKQYQDAKAQKEKAEAKQVKDAGKKNVFVGDEVSGSSVSVNYINQKRRDNAIKNAQEDMNRAIDDLKSLGLTQEEIDSELSPKTIAASESVIEESSSPTKSPKKQVRKKVVAMVQDKTPSKTITEWKKESLDLIDKVVNILLDNYSQNKDARNKVIEQITPLSDIVDADALRLLNEAGVQILKDRFLIIPTPKGQISASLGGLLTTRKEIAKLSDSKVVSNENTRIKNKQAAKADVSDFYEPESKADAKDELDISTTVLENAKNSGNKKLIELAQIQHDFYKDWYNNFDSKQKDKLEEIAREERSLAAIKKREFIQGSKELKDLYNNSYELAREAGIYEIEEFYDFLQVIGVDKIPSKLTNEIAENLFAKAAIDSGAHSFLTYQVRIKNRKQAVTKVTARTSWKMQQKARQVEEMNKNIDRMLDLSSKYETGATKIFKELYQEESKTDRAIRFLEAAKIRAKGKALGVLPPLAIPIGLYNLSLQTMVIALKGGRVVNKAIKEAYAIVKDYISEADYRKHLLELGVISDEFLEVPAEAETAQPESVVTKTSKHFKTITNNKSLNELTKDLKEEDFQYQEVSRQSNTDAAIEYVTENGVEVSLNNFKGSKGLIEGLTTAQRVAVGQVLYRALNSAKKEALKNNDMEQANYIQNEMAQVTSVLQKFGTSLGQGVSQFAEFMLDFSDPVTAAFNMQKHVEAVNAKQRDSGAVKKNSENIAKDINNTVKNGKKKVVKEVVKTVNEELYGLITLGKKGLTDTQKQKVKSIFNTFKVDPNGSSLQAKILPIKEVVAMVVTPKVYNDFIDKVGELVAEGVSLSVAMTRVSAEFIKDKIASPQAMEVVRKRLSEQVKGLKETKPLTEKQKEAKAAREELKEATKEYETLVNELVSEYLQLSPDQKTNNKKLIEMVMDKLGVDERSAKVIATKIAEGVAKNIKKKLENKFANQLSAEERAAKAKGIKPKENPIDEIIAASDTGIAPELVQEYFKNKYGIEELSVQDIQTIQEIAKKIAAAPTENRRGVLLGQIQRAIDSKRQKTLSELFQNLWYARVLSPVLLQIPIGTGDTNITYNLITLLNQTKVYPLTSIFNLITNLKKTIASEKPRTKGELLATITGSLQEAILGAFNAIGQNVIYNEAEQNKIKKFLSVLTNSRYLSQSISYYRTAITDGLDYKKEHDNPFKATAGGKFDISDWSNTLKKAENGDKSAQNKVALAVRAIINGYVNGVTNTLGGQDLFFGSIVGNLYKPALLREKFFEEGFRGKELNAKVFESIVNTKLEYENARQKAIQYRLEQDITIEPKVNMRTNELTYEVKDNGKLKETFDNKEDAETYAREKLAPKGNNFRNDVNYLLNQKIGDIVNKQSERISRNLLLSGDVEGGTRYINNFLQAFQDLFAKWSETLNDKALANNLYDALDIKNMALNLDLKTFEAIYKKAKAIIFKALSIPIKALENLLAFKRVGLNAVRMASNFITPLGLLRYSASFYSKGENSMGLTGQMSYKMTDTERNQILSMAIIGGLTFQFGAIVKKAIQDALKGDDEEEKKELTKEKENSQRLFKEWYKKTTGEEITKEINAFYSQLTEGQVIGSLSWMTDDRKRFYERTGLIIEYSVFEGFNEQGKPIYSTVKNRPDQAMNISVATYQLIDAFGDEEDKDNILLYSAMTPLYSWKDMSIGQGGISILFSRPSPQRLFEKVAQIAVLDNFEVLNPRLIPVTLGYFDQKMRKTPTLFESIKNEATIYGGFKDWMFMRVAPAYAGYNQAMKATQIYGMFGEELYRIPNESQGMISNMISEYVKSDKNMEEQKMQMWLDINGYNKKIWTPNKDEPILIDDKVKELTYEQLNKYGRIGGKKTLEELKSKLKDLQELRQIGEEDASTEEQRINNFRSQIDEIFKKNFQHAYFEGEKTFGADTKKFLEGKQKLFDESFALKVEKVKDKSDIISEVDKTLIVTEEEQKDRAMNKSIDQYLSEMKDLSNREKIKKLERLFDIRSISQNEYDYAYDLIKNK